MIKKKRRAVYHTFKRRDPEDGAAWRLTALVRSGKAPSGGGPIELPINEAGVLEAIRRNGQADSQNCAGAVCTMKHKKLFGHSVSPIVDWWQSRVYILESDSPRGRNICRQYAHYDHVAELFDGSEADLQRLLKRVRNAGGEIIVRLYPVTPGLRPKTGKPTAPGARGYPGGAHRKPKLTGDQLRLSRYLSARGVAA